MLIIAADMHIRPGTPASAEFFEFLNWISSTDCDVCFLGDVIELWIGVTGYGNSLQDDFIAWCRHEVRRRRVFFVEGNHEFFVAGAYPGAFTASACDTLSEYGGALLFCHGDICQSSKRLHLFLRWWMKSALALLLLRFLPFAGRCVKRIQRIFRAHSMRRRRRGFIPQREIDAWADAQSAALPTLEAIFMGHFHRRLSSRRNGVRLVVLPAWKECGEIGMYSVEDKSFEIVSWRSVRARSLASRATFKDDVQTQCCK